MNWNPMWFSLVSGNVALAVAEDCSITAAVPCGGRRPGDGRGVNSRTRARAALRKACAIAAAKHEEAYAMRRDAIALDDASEQLVGSGDQLRYARLGLSPQRLSDAETRPRAVTW